MAKSKDEATGGAPTQIAVDAATLETYGRMIAEIDAQVASASGSDTVARKAWIESLIMQNQTEVDSNASQIIDFVTGLDLPLLVGLVTKLEERLKAELAPKVTAYVDEEFPKTQTTGKDEVEGLKTRRKELLVQFKALREVLNTFGIKNDHVLDPKRSGGGRPVGSGGGGGKKSGSNKEGYRYTMDGKKRPPSQNTFSSLAFYSTDNCPAEVLKTDSTFQGLTEDAQAAAIKALPKKWGAPQLREFLKGQGVTMEEDSWEVSLPNNKKIGAARLTDEDKIELGVVADANETTENSDPIHEATVHGELDGATA